MRGADAVARTLQSAGVKRIFTVSGNQIMPLFDACLDADIEQGNRILLSKDLE